MHTRGVHEDKGAVLRCSSCGEIQYTFAPGEALDIKSHPQSVQHVNVSRLVRCSCGEKTIRIVVSVGASR